MTAPNPAPAASPPASRIHHRRLISAFIAITTFYYNILRAADFVVHNRQPGIDIRLDRALSGAIFVICIIKDVGL